MYDCGNTNQTVETRWEVDKDWEVMTQRGIKKRAEGNINARKKEVLNLKGQAVVTANRYAALETDSRLLRNEDGLETMYEETIGTIQKDQTEIMKSTAQNYTITSISKKKCGLEHNLQKHCLIHQLSNTKKTSTTFQPY